MTSSLKETLRRGLKSPVAIVGVIGSTLVVLANAAPAIDGAKVLWQRWTHQQAGLETNWQGTWKSRNGYNFAFAMQLDVREDETAEGKISWELVATPPNSHLANRIGDSATEYVSGHFDRANNLATVAGYDVTDPTLIALDSYKFQIKNDKISFIAMTKHRGEWEAEAQGSVIVTAKQSAYVIEHNLEVIKTADWVIDLGPQGGDGGGRIIAARTPEDVAATKESYTGQYLRELLGRRAKSGKRQAAE